MISCKIWSSFRKVFTLVEVTVWSPNTLVLIVVVTWTSPVGRVVVVF